MVMEDTGDGDAGDALPLDDPTLDPGDPSLDAPEPAEPDA